MTRRKWPSGQRAISGVVIEDLSDEKTRVKQA
jgi:hypothetical protein